MKRLAIALLLCSLPPLTAAADLSTSQRLELLERRVNQVTNLTLQLDQLRSENRQLRGEIESLGYELEQLKRKQSDMYLDLDQRLGSGGAAPVGAAAPADAIGSAGGPTTVDDEPRRAAGTADEAAIQAEYDAAKALLSPQQKRYAESAKAFEAFLAKYPRHELASNAQYWLGEAHYVTQNNPASLKAFEGVVKGYPGSTKVPDALYKIGKLKQASGDRAAARSSYETVLAEHPGSAAAGLARQALDSLR